MRIGDGTFGWTGQLPGGRFGPWQARQKQARLWPAAKSVRIPVGCCDMRKRHVISGIILMVAASIAILGKCKYPYGASHCCIIGMMGALEEYAQNNRGHYPTGQASPEASLSLLYRSNYIDANTLRGMTVPEITVSRILKSGGVLGPDTCGWQYIDGLTYADDNREWQSCTANRPWDTTGNGARGDGRSYLLVVT